MATCVFKRIEKKYLLSEAQYNALFQEIGSYLKPDKYGRSTVLSLYLDTPDRRIIRSSMEAVDYKEKLRLRSYGTAGADSTVFLELKKKFGGVVYKRRAAMTLKEAERYLRTGIRPFESQIMSELDWAMRLYGWPTGAMLIACEREAWFDEEHPDLRLTFDRDIRYRENELRLDRGSAGIRLLPGGTVLLEIKTAGAMPLWLADALDAEAILPGSFSKYGTAYLHALEEKQRSVSMIEEEEEKNMSSIYNSFILTGSFSLGQYLLSLLFAGLCGAITALSLSRESNATRSFLISLVVLPIIVTTVILMVNGNVGTGIAVAGAFSLVRFRSAAGKARDISAIFLVMTAGLTCAAGYGAVALLFTLIASGVMLLLSRIPMSCDRFVALHITVPESLHFADAFDDLFEQYTKSRKLVKAKTSNMGSLYKLDYKIEMKDPAAAQEFLDALRCRNGNLEIAILNEAEGGDEL